jgi:hypothetical protein
VTGRARALAALALLAVLSVASAPPATAAPLTEAGRRAYEMARAADDGAAAALEEGDASLARAKALVPAESSGASAPPAFVAEAEAAYEALIGYRRLAQASATDALGLLADVAKLPSVPSTDVVQRDTLEQHALLAAHEAAVMAARARAEAERLRAVLAEARLAVGASPRREDRSAAAPLPAGGGGAAAGPGVGPAADGAEVAVPNLVGARLDAASRDLQGRALRLGTVTGPREGFVVKQSPEAGTPVPRGSAVAVTLSGTAATIAPPR